MKSLNIRFLKKKSKKSRILIMIIIIDFKYIILYLLYNDKKTKVILDFKTNENYISRNYVFRIKILIRNKKYSY